MSTTKPKFVQIENMTQGIEDALTNASAPASGNAFVTQSELASSTGITSQQVAFITPGNNVTFNFPASSKALIAMGGASVTGGGNGPSNGLAVSRLSDGFTTASWSDQNADNNTSSGFPHLVIFESAGSNQAIIEVANSTQIRIRSDNTPFGGISILVVTEA